MNGKQEAKTVLPPIPAKRYFTIGEVSELCGVKPHVLRYWEQEFTQLRPMKRRGNRRYYQHHEVLLVRRIRELLYEEGFTINGARNRLGEMGGNGRLRAPVGAAALEAIEAERRAAGLASSDAQSVLAAGSEAGELPGAGALGFSPTAEGAPPVSGAASQGALPFAFNSAQGLAAVREALEQALDLLR